MTCSLLNRPTRNGGVSGESSSEILARILNDTEPHDRVSIFWMGRNNYSAAATVEADIAAAVAHLHGDQRFLVLSIINGIYENEHAGGTGYTRSQSSMPSLRRGIRTTSSTSGVRSSPAMTRTIRATRRVTRWTRLPLRSESTPCT
jgi:hypothetical protein